MDPAWSGVIDSSTKLGVLLVQRPGEYSRAGFEALASTDDALRPLVPGLQWVPVDSSHPLLANLGGWDLDSLSLGLLADSMVWNLPYPRVGEDLVLRQVQLAEPTRTALRRIGSAFDLQLLIALRPGESTAGKNSKPAPELTEAQREQRRAAAAGGQVLAAAGDSSRSWKDAVWFGVFDLRSGSLWYSRDIPAQGAMSQSMSAEGAWARSAWQGFADVLRELPARRQNALTAEPR